MCAHAHLFDPLSVPAQIYLHVFTHTCRDFIKLSHLGQVCSALFCLVFVPKESQGKFITKALCVHALAYKTEAVQGMRKKAERYTVFLVFKLGIWWFSKGNGCAKSKHLSNKWCRSGRYLPCSTTGDFSQSACEVQSVVWFLLLTFFFFFFFDQKHLKLLNVLFLCCTARSSDGTHGIRVRSPLLL